MVGTTRSRVSFFMNRFRKLGFVQYNGGIHVHKSLLNVVLHDQVPEENAVSAPLLGVLPNELKPVRRRVSKTERLGA